MFFKSSIITMKNDIWDFFDIYEKEIPFVEASNRVDYYNLIPEDTAVADREYMSIFFRADSENRIYKLEGYDILTFLGDIGGLFDIIIVLGMGITSMFAGQLFMAALISDSYNIQSYFRDSSEFYEARKNDNKLTTESESKSSIESQPVSPDTIGAGSPKLPESG